MRTGPSGVVSDHTNVAIVGPVGVLPNRLFGAMKIKHIGSAPIDLEVIAQGRVRVAEVKFIACKFQIAAS